MLHKAILHDRKKNKLDKQLSRQGMYVHTVCTTYVCNMCIAMYSVIHYGSALVSVHCLSVQGWVLESRNKAAAQSLSQDSEFSLT